MGNRSNHNEEWAGINLRTFFTILNLSNPNVKQSQIAEDLGIAPATLSRIINGTYGDGKMRMEWIPVLEPYLMSDDMHRLMGELKAIEALHNSYDIELKHKLVRLIIAEYPDGNEWFLDNMWTYADSLRYDGENSEAWVLIDVPNVHSNIRDSFAYYKGYIKYGMVTRFSFLCYDEATFNKCVKDLNFSYNFEGFEKRGIKFSAMWVDIAQQKLVSEYFLRSEL